MEKKELIKKAEQLLYESEHRFNVLNDFEALWNESKHQLNIIHSLFYFNEDSDELDSTKG